VCPTRYRYIYIYSVYHSLPIYIYIYMCIYIYSVSNSLPIYIYIVCPTRYRYVYIQCVPLATDIYTVCPTRHRYIYIYIYIHTVCPTRHFFNNFTTNEDIATKFEADYRHIPLHFSHNESTPAQIWLQYLHWC